MFVLRNKDGWYVTVCMNGWWNLTNYEEIAIKFTSFWDALKFWAQLPRYARKGTRIIRYGKEV